MILKMLNRNQYNKVKYNEVNYIPKSLATEFIAYKLKYTSIYNVSQFNTARYSIGFQAPKPWIIEFRSDNFKLSSNDFLFLNIQYQDVNSPYTIYDYWDRKQINLSRFIEDADKKQVIIKWMIAENNRKDLIEKAERIKGKIVRQKGKLYINECITKVAEVYCDKVIFDENTYNTTEMQFEIYFTIFRWFEWGKKVANYSMNGNTYSFKVLNEWYNLAYWDIILNITNTTWTYVNIKIGNDTDITFNIEQNTYHIDSKELAVYKWWTEINYDWILWLFENWLNEIELSSDWNITADISFIYSITYR